MKFITGLLLGTIAAIAIERGFHHDLLVLVSSAWDQQVSDVSELPQVTDQSMGEVFVEVPSARRDGQETETESAIIEYLQENVTAPQQVDSPPVLAEEEQIVPVHFEPAPETETNTDNSASVFQVAWIPFHSEASASGFAWKLTRQLNRKFEAVRISRGKYEVGFHYQNSDDRDQVLGAIEQMTGYRVPDPS